MRILKIILKLLSFKCLSSDRLEGGGIRKVFFGALLVHKIYFPVTKTLGVIRENPFSQKPQLWGVG